MPLSAGETVWGSKLHGPYTRTNSLSHEVSMYQLLFAPPLVHSSPEQNILPQGPGLNPGLLRRVG